MSFLGWLSVAGVCLLGAVSPGPSFALVVRNTIRGSRKNGMITGLAHCVGVGIYALLTVSGLAAVLTAHPPIYRGVTYCGGVYLAWMGIMALLPRKGAGKKKGAAETLFPEEKRGGDRFTSGTLSAFGAARDGFVMSMLNPKLIIFFAALFSQFVQTGMQVTASAIMVVTALGIDGLWYCLVAITLSRKGYIDKLNRYASRIDRVMGILFLVLALRVFTL